WMIEETKCKLHSQHTPDSLVHGRFRYGVAANQSDQTRMISAAFHIHIQAGSNRFLRSRCTVQGDTMCYQLVDSPPVAYDEAAEVPFLAKNICQCVRVGSCRNAVQRVEGTHHRCGACIDGCVIWRQIDLPQ